MISIASRLEHVSEYYFASKLREIAQLCREGRPVINLGIGSPDLPPHPSVVQALKHGAESHTAHGYQSYSGIPALREGWANWYSTHYGVSLNGEQEVLPLTGSKEGIAHIAFAFLSAGDVALVPDPGYPTYRAASLLAGAEVRSYDLSAHNGWLPDFEALERTDLSRVKILWANYPHMPTGAPASTEVFQHLVGFAKRHNILVVNDNPYSFILNDTPRSILSIPGAMEIALELNSLSKSHNMAGWRMGMIAGHAEYLKAILRFKSNLDSGQFLPMQLAACAALNLPAEWYQSLNEIYRKRQSLAFELLDGIDCRFDVKQHGLFVWAKIPHGFADGFAFSDYLLYEHNLFLTPGGIFGSAGQQYVRISLCSPETTLKEALNSILNEA